MPTMKKLQRIMQNHLSDDKNKDKILSDSYEAIFMYFWNLEIPNLSEILSGNDKINRKGLEESNVLRNEGNRLYKIKKYSEALTAYNYALLVAPHPSSADDKSAILEESAIPQKSKYSDGEFSALAFAYANRSALLYEMEQFSKAISDIHNAIKYGYTYSKLNKIYERKVKCLIGLKQFHEAKQLSETLIDNVERFSLDNQETVGVRTNFQKFSQKCSKIIDLSSQSNSSIPSINEPIESGYHRLFHRGPERGNFTVRDESKMASVNSKIAIKNSASRGRFMVATKPIEPGEVLLVERSSFSYINFDGHLRRYCDSCMRRVTVPTPCCTCSLVVYCDENCRSARAIQHSDECPILPVLIKFRPDIDSGIAFKILISTNLDEMIKCHQENRRTDNNFNFLGNLREENPNYSFIRTLDGNLKARSNQEKEEAAILAVSLARILQNSPKFRNFFSEASKLKYLPAIGSEIIQLILNIQCNVHCIKELELKDNTQFEDLKLQDVGYGLFQKLSLINHSCAPNAHQSNLGNEKILFSLSTIETGQEISITYGERFLTHDKLTRQKNLAETYFFQCDCNACVQDWPKFNDLPLKIHLKCCKCSSQIDISTQKCTKCNLQHKGASKKLNKKNKKGNHDQLPNNFFDASLALESMGKSWTEFSQAFTNVEKNNVTDEDFNNIKNLLITVSKFGQLPNKPFYQAQEALIRVFDLRGSHHYYRR